MTDLNGAVVLITGANGGIGTQFVHEVLARGAAKVYASARNPQGWDDERVIPLQLDVTDQSSINAALTAAPDVTILINNAGIGVSTAGILEHSDEDIRKNIETNFIGPLFLSRAFAPQLVACGGNTAIINIHSVLAWYVTLGIYSATKAALWSATNSLRLELNPAGVHVVGVHVGMVDTNMTAGNDAPKLDPADLVNQVLDATEAGEFEVIADEISTSIKSGLSAPLEVLYPQLTQHN